MLTLKSEAAEDLASLPSPAAAKELEHWERVVFAFDMDRDQQPPNPRNPPRSRSTSSSTNAQGQQQHSLDNSGASEFTTFYFHPRTSGTSIPSDLQDAALLAQFAAAASGTADLDQPYPGMVPQGTPYPSMAPSPGFYGNFLHHTSMPPPQLPPLSSLDFAWHGVQTHHPQAGPSHYDPHHSHPSTGMLPFLDPHYGSLPASASASTSASTSDATRASAGRGRGSHSPGAASSSSPPADDEQGRAIADEKRRRNTAASGKSTCLPTLDSSQHSSTARFRIKKKHKTITLERSVSDLTGRAEELEREVADLRRENGWLKEIVMLKGTQFAASNLAHRQALSQAAALATGSASMSQGASASGSGGGAPTTRSEPSTDEEESESEVEDKSKKGKGKKPAKSSKK
ncbi:unnamed protein product [Cyclocybe aegerita]|uniref:BZIP domain-containing protein n=1 Tax=Cyclocybe aegerita TaxID=1973307 RepID=A0A8S0VSU7_CYCAE|nr:unnamed protein product [Cyclocybe aegerita]